MAASLDEHGHAAIVLDTGGVSRGSGSKSNNKEKTIRQAFVETDWIEGVILLPENLFYNTTAPGIILLLDKARPAGAPGPNPAGQRVQPLRQGEAEERPDRRGGRRGGRGLPDLGDARETKPGHHVGRSTGGGYWGARPSLFVEVGIALQHRPLTDVMADLVVARAIGSWRMRS